jgi:alpha-tubulin suppressor-like RCC1 family protein
VRDTGRVFCWGHNSYGQLGDGSATDRLTPVRVIGLTNAVQVTGGGGHSCGIRPNGRAYCWGWNAFGQIGAGANTNRWTAVRVAN